MWRLPDDDETIEGMERMERAFRSRVRVTVSWFVSLRDKEGRELFFNDSPSLMRAFGRRPVLTAVPWRRRDVEVITDVLYTSGGMPYVDVLLPSEKHEEYPAPRTIRLDRVAVGARGLLLHVTRQPCRAAGTWMDPNARSVTPA